MHYSVVPRGVCPKKIDFDLEGDVVKNVAFTGGCPGNLKAISKIIDGMKVEEIEKYFLGNTCGVKDTSCADQLARALRQKLDESRAEAKK